MVLGFKWIIILSVNEFGKPEIICSAIFEENIEVFYSPVVIVGGIMQKPLTFSNISVITEDVHLKLKTSCLLSKGGPIPVGR